MPKSEKVKVNVKERVSDNVCDLSLSELNEVPVREIATYKRVTVLDLSSNRLITLGKNFTCLTRLVKLDLSKNQIKYLPEDFGLLRNLKHLDLYDNKLEHLPLSFGDLSNLRYLDLKGNPLTPALGKIVGFCLTTKDCQDSAKNTVKFLAQMQLQAEKAKDQYTMESIHGQETVTDNKPTTTPTTTTIETNTSENQTAKKSNNKKSKTKPKTKTSNATTNNNNKKEGTSAASGQKAQASNSNMQTNKAAKAKKATNGGAHKKQTAAGKARKGSTALTSIFVFCFLLGVNIAVIYMIMFKNPEIAEKLVEFIPHQYRDWILSKTEFFRLRVTDWITEFRTQPEEH